MVRYPPANGLEGEDPQEGVSTIKFDDTHDLLWVGEKNGRLKSFRGAGLQLYTSCRAHFGPVLKILNHKRGVLTLSTNVVRLGHRQGYTLYNVEFSVGTKLTSMTYTSNTQSEVLVGGEADSTGFKIYKIDTVHRRVSGYVSYKHDILHMDTNLKHVVIGRMDGVIDILDPKTDIIVKSFSPISTGLFNMSVKDNTLLVTGYSVKSGAGKNKQPQPLFDAWVSSYNLKSLTVQTPIPFPARAAYVIQHPTIPHVVLMATISGDNMTFMDVVNPSHAQFYHADMPSYITSIDLSPSGQYLAFTDPMHNLTLWSRDLNYHFSFLDKPLDYPSPPAEHIPPESQITRRDSPLSSIKLPPYNTLLSSAWPSDLKFKVGRLPTQIDPEILRSSELNSTGYVITKYDRDRFGPRYHSQGDTKIDYKREAQKAKTPKFISEREDVDDFYSVLEDGLLPQEVKRHQEDPNHPIFDCTSIGGDVPSVYSQMSISYSKFGVDDFDFDFYNRTQYAGLEIISGSSFMNPLFQLYRFTAPIFNYAIDTIAEDVTEETNMLVELGYLFDMLVKAKGRHCAASNFQRLFSSLPEAQSFGLIGDNCFVMDDYKQRKIIQTFNRFLLRKLSLDECKLYFTEESLKLNEICGVATNTTVFSKFCPLAQKREGIYQTIDVNSRPIGLNSMILHDVTILNYLEASMNRHIQQQIICENCGVEHPVNAALQICDLPPVIILNLDFSNQTMAEIRTFDGWLVPEFYSVQATMGTPVLRKNVITGFAGIKKKYELIGVTFQITNKKNESHFVTFSKIKKNKADPGKWHLFNDFLVCEVDEKEVLDVSYWWKRPTIVIYKQVDVEDNFKVDSYKSHLNDSVLYKDHFAATIREGMKIEYELLTRQEAPKIGTLVAIDAEFVELEPPVYEFTSAGQKRLIKPPKLSVGRISVLRGEGPKEGECFIDDYIVTTEKIHDYKTVFSGIEVGDLNPATSTKSLVSLQTAYRRIWLLLNLGCVMVGHSLIGDFRMINIQVSPMQVRDTAICYYSKSEKRKLGLKFLVYHVLNDEVQKGNHDSIEDARSALRLYKKYQQLKKDGKLEEVINKVYVEGQMSGFRVPSAGNGAPSETPTVITK